MKHPALLLSALLLLPSAAWAQANGRGDKPTAETQKTTPARLGEAAFRTDVVAVRVTRVDLDRERFPLQVQMRGSEVVLRVMVDSLDTGRSILGVDLDTSRITGFADDRGTDLQQPRKREAAADGFQGAGGAPGAGGGLSTPAVPIVRFDPLSDLAADRCAALVRITAPGVPAAGATAVRVEGALILNTALGTVAESVPAAPLEPRDVSLEGRSIAIAGVETQTQTPLPLKMSDPMPAPVAETSVSFDISPATAAGLASIRFLDVDGAALPATLQTTLDPSPRAPVTYRITASKEAIATIEFQFWQEVQQVRIPLDLTVTLGGAVTD